MRNDAIKEISQQSKISEQTIRKYLCRYLVYQNIAALAPKKKCVEKNITDDEKNMRWALNKFFYTKRKNSLKTAYTLMLKEKYCNSEGELIMKHPSYYQFRYFYRKNKNMKRFYISRDGIKDYQKNKRPLTGDGIQEYAPNVGVGMIDATICDIYLVNEKRQLVGRPILTACIDAYSSLCCGYTLSWEGGVYSIKNLMMNVIADKVKWCKSFGIELEKELWDSSLMPGKIVTDMGTEYKSENFEQITELGVIVVNLPAYRPELKGAVEKFFDMIQNLYKPYLKGKGVVETDFRERGAHDYRKDACLTMEDFEKIILHCIIYYNTQRILERFPYTDEMIAESIKPYASHVWNWGKKQAGANLIKVTDRELMLTLLPRTKGKFTRFGLKVNKLRYNNDNYTEAYLSGGEIDVAYNPDNVTNVWLIENGNYVKFDLIESRFEGKNLDSVISLKKEQQNLINHAAEENLQTKIDLIEHINVISDKRKTDVNIKNIRDIRKREQMKTHINYVGEGVEYE